MTAPNNDEEILSGWLDVEDPDRRYEIQTERCAPAHKAAPVTGALHRRSTDDPLTKDSQ